MLELLGRLAAKSMVLVEEPRLGDPVVLRYRFLETIRQYAEQKAARAGEADRVRTQHRDWYLSLAEQGMDGMEGPDQKEWWERLELEHDNLRAALAWSASGPDSASQLLHIAACLGRFWGWRGHAREGIGWLDRALARNATSPSPDRARALNWRGLLEWASGNSQAARAFLEESIAQARAVGDGRVLSLSLRHLAMLAHSAEEYVEARGLVQEALTVSREVGSEREIAWNLSVNGENLAIAGQHDKAEALLEESIVVGRDSGDLTPVLRSMLVLSRMYGSARLALDALSRVGCPSDVSSMSGSLRPAWRSRWAIWPRPKVTGRRPSEPIASRWRRPPATAELATRGAARSRSAPGARLHRRRLGRHLAGRRVAGPSIVDERGRVDRNVATPPPHDRARHSRSSCDERGANAAGEPSLDPDVGSR